MKFPLLFGASRSLDDLNYIFGARVRGNLPDVRFDFISLNHLGGTSLMNVWYSLIRVIRNPVEGEVRDPHGITTTRRSPHVAQDGLLKGPRTIHCHNYGIRYCLSKIIVFHCHRSLLSNVPHIGEPPSKLLVNLKAKPVGSYIIPDFMYKVNL